MADSKFKYSAKEDTRDYYYHDDRGDQRQVKFKSGKRRNRWRRGGYNSLDTHPYYDREGDIQMIKDNESQHKTRYSPFENRRKFRNKRRGGVGGGGDFMRGAGSSRGGRDRDGWYRIHIPHGKKNDKEFILRSINELCELPFVPYYFHYEAEHAVFYVDNKEAARAIEKVSGKVTTPSGFKLRIKAHPSGPPQIPLDDSVLEKIKLAMSNRFSVVDNSLDLSAFYLNPELKSQGIHASLDRMNVLTKVVKIIEENVQQLQILNLTGNKLSSLESLKPLAAKHKNLRVLLLGKNNLRNIIELDHIKDLMLEELVLDENPLCDNFSDQASYVSAVRQRFPKITRLDGHDLPPQYGFDLTKAAVLPVSLGNFFINDKTREIVPQFLEQYFCLYDSTDRQGLLDAYHDHALFSLTALQPKGSGSHSNLNAYLSDNRNLLKLNNFGRKMKLLLQSKLSVVSFLCQLPRTQHDPASFSVDVTQTLNAMTITCSGIFKEVDSRQSNAPIRAFNRVFVIVPFGTGFCIVNEMLFITNATVEQIKLAFKVPAPTPSPSPVPPAVATVTSAEQQEQMVLSFAQQSGMNLAWSRQCLEQNKWDYETAAHVFQELKKLSRIPQEAFERS